MLHYLNNNNANNNANNCHYENADQLVNYYVDQKNQEVIRGLKMDYYRGINRINVVEVVGSNHHHYSRTNGNSNNNGINNGINNNK